MGFHSSGPEAGSYYLHAGGVDLFDNLPGLLPDLSLWPAERRWKGSVEFTAVGWVRPLYYVIAITHFILAFTILPLVILTVIPALRARFDSHRRMGLFTMPIWLYVSVTGVIVYFMLYQWFPSTHLDELKRRYELKARSS